MVRPQCHGALPKWRKATVAALSAALLTLAAPLADAREGAPIVFGRQQAPSQAAPARVEYVSATRRAAPASADQPDALYGYGSGHRRSAAPIDLRGAPASAQRAESLGDDAFDNDDTQVSPPATQPAVVRASAPAAQAATQQATVQTVSARPEWLERERTGAPYEANGQWYVPTAEPAYSENGSASWYGADFQGRRTASGETFDSEALTAAHPTLPIPSLVQVTNLENGREVIVRVNDRGPFHADRLIDVSRRAAEVLGFERQGNARVNVRYLGPAPKRVGADGSGVADVASTPVAAADPVTPAPIRAASPAAPGNGAYFVQVGAFSNPANVERARNVLGQAGAVTVDRLQANGAALQRVRVGSWQSRSEAEAARETVAGLGYPGAVVTGGR